MSYTVTPNMEPYRKGQSFATWVRRLEIHFRVNKVDAGQKKDQMFLLGGDYLFCVAEKLYPTEVALEQVTYDDLVQKLKEKLDKTESVLIQRYNFGMKIQQPGESASDFIFSLKLLAEHCEFGEQKNRLVLDRILVGLTDTNLKHRILTEDSAKLTLAQAEQIITTWEMAATHTKALANKEEVGLVASLNSRYPLTGGRGAVTQRIKELSQGFRRSVKSRLGVRPELRPEEDRQHRIRFPSQRPSYRDSSAGPSHRQYKTDNQRWPVDQRFCDFCGRRGHVRRKCFQLKNDKKETVNHVEEPQPSTSTTSLANRLSRLRTLDQDSDDSDSDHGWKRGNDNRTSNADQSS
nr:uncharacterized protein LOC109402721 [Aedes albopictus]